ncbi:MAG: hypothetical protein AAF804_21665, partial [Bacteroidota bacterium]
MNQNTVQKYLFYFLLIPFLWLASCEKVVDFQASAYQPKLVVYGALFADSTPGIMVGETRTYYGWEEYIKSQLYVERAEVSLSNGREEESLQLGRYANDLFNIWRGNPGGYRMYQFEEFNSGPDSALRLYEGGSRLAGGRWYDFKASYRDLSTEKRIYLPLKGRNVEVEFRARDTSYVREIFGGGSAQEEVKETLFELVISYDLNDPESHIWHKPIIRS